MALSSMTGFARRRGSGGPYVFEWELKSVNAKGFDFRLRTPPGWDGLEGVLRQRAAALLTRGTVTANLQLKRSTVAYDFRLDEQVLAAAISAAGAIAARLNAPPPSVDALIGIKGVIDIQEQEINDEDRAAGEQAVMAAFDAALHDLVAMRRREGAALGMVLESRLGELAALSAQAETTPGRKPEAIKARLAAQIADLMETGSRFDSERLHQEAILIAAKADIREELDRIASHIAQARDVIAEGGSVGRKLDFLAQEFNREVNTTCSKSGDVALTKIGLEMKSVVEQFREQVQNLE